MLCNIRVARYTSSQISNASLHSQNFFFEIVKTKFHNSNTGLSEGSINNHTKYPKKSRSDFKYIGKRVCCTKIRDLSTGTVKANSVYVAQTNNNTHRQQVLTRTVHNDDCFRWMAWKSTWARYCCSAQQTLQQKHQKPDIVAERMCLEGDISTSPMKQHLYMLSSVYIALVGKTVRCRIREYTFIYKYYKLASDSFALCMMFQHKHKILYTQNAPYIISLETEKSFFVLSE